MRVILFVGGLCFAGAGCGGRVDAAAPASDAAIDGAGDAGASSSPMCNFLSIPAPAEDQSVIGNAPFYTHATFVGVPVPDGRYALVARRAWRPAPSIDVPAYAGPIAAAIEVRGDVWDWAEDDGGTVTHRTYVVTEEEGRYLRLTPSCGGGDSWKLGAIRRGSSLSLYEFLESSGGITVPVELVFIHS